MNTSFLFDRIKSCAIKAIDWDDFAIQISANCLFLHFLLVCPLFIPIAIPNFSCFSCSQFHLSFLWLLYHIDSWFVKKIFFGFHSAQSLNLHTRGIWSTFVTRATERPRVRDVFVGLVLCEQLALSLIRCASPHLHNYNTILGGLCQHLFDIFFILVQSTPTWWAINSTARIVGCLCPTYLYSGWQVANAFSMDLLVNYATSTLRRNHSLLC